MAVGALAGITSVLLVMMLGQIRIFFAMSRDGLLRPRLATVHSRFHTPSLATIMTGLGLALFAGFVSIGEAADMTNIGALFAFCLACVGVLWVLVTQPEHPRPFRLPWMLWDPRDVNTIVFRTHALSPINHLDAFWSVDAYRPRGLCLLWPSSQSVAPHLMNRSRESNEV